MTVAPRSIASQWAHYRDTIILPNDPHVSAATLQTCELGFYAGVLRMLKLANDLQAQQLLGALSDEEAADIMVAWLAEIGARNEQFAKEAAA